MKAERRMDDWIGLKVRLLRDIKTAGGKVYAAGSWWTVMSHHRGRLALLSGVGCLSNEPHRDVIRQVNKIDVEVDPWGKH